MKNWVLPDRDQMLLLAPSISDWLAENHLARFVAEVVDGIDLSPILAKYEARSRGSSPYHPSLLVALLFYGYATGTMSSRKIEMATFDSVPFRFLSGGHHPDHTTLAEFRRCHLEELKALFVQILLIAREMGFMKVGAVAIDGTKVKANASKHAAVSYKRAKEIEARLSAEVTVLMRAAEEADNTPLRDGIDIPSEIARREKRIEKMREAQRVIEERHNAEAAGLYEQELAETLEKTEESVRSVLSGKRTKRPPDPPEPPSATPPGKAQHNFTDPQSRIMPDKGTFSQAYNAQAAVDTETMLIVGQRVTQNPGDRRELLPMLPCIDVYTPTSVAADAGFYSKDNVRNCPIDAYISPGRTMHDQPLEERLGPHASGPAPAGSTPAEAMRHKLKTETGSALYRQRKMTVEPAFGIIKSAMGFRQFLLRGAEKVRGEWALVCLGYNLRRLWSLQNAARS